MAEILHRLGYVRKGHLVAVTRDDLVGQYIGHTAPKTKEVMKRAMGGVLFIDEAYYLYRPENERDYGQEAIEILLQIMENQREDIVVILAGYKEKMERFFQSNPGMSSRIAHHLDFPDYDAEELLAIAKLMLERQQYRSQFQVRKRLRRTTSAAQEDAALRERPQRCAMRSTARGCARQVTFCRGRAPSQVDASLDHRRAGDLFEPCFWRAAMASSDQRRCVAGPDSGDAMLQADDCDVDGSTGGTEAANCAA